MKIRVAVNNVTINKKNKRLCGRNCPGLYFTPDDGYMCTVFGWPTLKRVQEEFCETEPMRCRSCMQNELSPKGGFKR